MSIINCNVCHTTRDTDYYTECIFCDTTDCKEDDTTARGTIMQLSRRYGENRRQYVSDTSKVIPRIRPLSEYTLEELEQLYPETI